MQDSGTYEEEAVKNHFLVVSRLIDNNNNIEE